MFGVDVEEAGRREFHIESCLGRGGFGEVYRATMRSPGGLQSEVAVKVLHEGLDPRGQAVQRLRDEGKLLARLDHPAILRVHDLVLLDGRIALVTEFIDGQDLGEVVAGPGRIGLRALLEVIGAVGGALDSAWNAPLGDLGEPLRLIHRDIKPSNIRVSRHGQVKLLDFGIARTDTVDREARTQTDLMVGSPAYMAPERFTDNEVDPASDVFALGCALHEGLAGERLLGDLSLPMLSALALDEGRYQDHLRDRFGQLPSDLPEPVLELLVQMLDYDPERRPTAAEVQSRCEELSDALHEQSLARWCRERPWPVVPADHGPLDGRTITEGTLVRSGAIAPVDSSDALTERAGPDDPGASADSLAVQRPSPPGHRGPRTGIALAVAGVVALMGVAVLGAGIAGGWAIGVFDSHAREAAVEPPAPVMATEAAPATGSPEAAAPGSAATPDATPEPVPVQEPVQEPVPELAQASPPPAPAARTASPAPVVPAPVAVDASPARAEPVVKAPPPAPAAPTGHVEVESDVEVELRQGAQHYDVPGDVPAGSYEVFGQFNQRDYKPGGLLQVEAGKRYTIVCSTRMMRCQTR